MARLTSDDRPASRAVQGPQDGIAPQSTVLADGQPLADAVFDGCRERLQALLGGHADLTVVEHTIASYPLDSEEKAALWLWAIAPFDPATLELSDLRDCP